MNLFAYVWAFIAFILIIQGLRTSREGRVNVRAFAFAALAIAFVILNVFIK